VSIVAALMLGSCGHRSAGLPIQQLSGNPPSQQTLAELDALACPDGVDAALWEELKEALEEALRSLPEPRLSSRDAGTREPRFENRDSSSCMAHSASTPPTGGANRVDDLGISDNGDGTYTLSWHYRNLGDYDQNGMVAIADLTPLAQHFGETYDPEAEPHCLQAVIDGSGNGVVDIADVTPIAQNFGIEVADYIVEGAAALEGQFSEVEAVPVGEATGAETGRAVLEHSITPGENAYFRVRARDEGGTPGDPSNTVGIALQILSVTPTEVKEGTVVTFGAEVLGAGPLSYEWDFGGGAQYEAYTEPSPKVVLTRETGDFPASLTVTGPTGADTYPFTLSKLAREWKYETLTSGFSVKDASLEWAASKLWAYMRESSIDPLLVKGYLYSGHPGDWEIEEIEYSRHLAVNSHGEPALMGWYGAFFQQDLCYAQKVNGQWLFEVVEERPFLTRGDFVFAAGDVPFIAYMYQRSEPTVAHELRYARKVDGAWERGLIDEGGEPGSFSQWIELAADSQGNPAVCYGTEGKLWLARWNGGEERWDREVVDEPETSDWGVGGFPVLNFDGENRPAIAYENVFVSEFSEIPKECLLVYAVREGGGWSKEVIASCTRPQSAAEPYKPWGLAHDPLGEPVLLYLNDSLDTRYTIIWRKGVAWEEMALPGRFYEKKYCRRLSFTSAGTPYILIVGGDDKEVMLGCYE